MSLKVNNRKEPSEARARKQSKNFGPAGDGVAVGVSAEPKKRKKAGALAKVAALVHAVTGGANGEKSRRGLVTGIGLAWNGNGYTQLAPKGKTARRRTPATRAIKAAARRVLMSRKRRRGWR